MRDAAIQNRDKYEQFLNKVELLKQLDPYERNKLCDCLEIKNYSVGEYVIKEGDKGDTFFMIMKGTANALKTVEGSNDQQVVYEYTDNMYFGELALLKDCPRQASIKTTVNLISRK